MDEEILRLRAALEFYADPATWDGATMQGRRAPILADRELLPHGERPVFGARARAALAST